MKFSTITAFLGAALTANAAPTTASAASSLDARGNSVNEIFIGYTGAKPQSKITWQTGDDLCRGEFKTFGAGKDFNPCHIDFVYNDQHLLFDKCGESAPELWSHNGDGQPQNHISTCTLDGRDHGCSIWEWPFQIEWKCEFPQ
ncbi:hypothetical protein BU23DRAFT_571851 [Bimuria novae-zelandiae CBS 107.79]|uniref:AA1-like domain-containing protein n=1 Tax=Bimuria novae-zelandiae CBS 107.79 TaxID=1447943 RepID=A0A6A5UXI7_9PLEO|nr:hypothetical protein BU23DRAFT_571851 [Bimuria novae-zelandiae CBS 107.79]